MPPAPPNSSLPRTRRKSRARLPDRPKQSLLPRGEGLGVAEINLFDPANPTTPSPLTQTAAAQVMQGGTVNGVTYDGRYGDFTSTTNPTNLPPQAGVLVPASHTLLGVVKRFQYPKNNFDPTTNTIAPALLVRQSVRFMGPHGRRPRFPRPASVLETGLDQRNQKRSLRHESFRRRHRSSLRQHVGRQPLRRLRPGTHAPPLRRRHRPTPPPPLGPLGHQHLPSTLPPKFPNP